MKVIASAILILVLSNVYGNDVSVLPKLPITEFSNCSMASEQYSYALLEELQSESEVVLFIHQPANALVANAVKEKFRQEWNILDAIQKETREYFFNQVDKSLDTILPLL